MALPANLPAADETPLVHGDYRINNLIFHPSEPCALAVLYWEMSTLGHLLAVFAYQCMNWRVSPEDFCQVKGHTFGTLASQLKTPTCGHIASAWTHHGAGLGLLPHLQHVPYGGNPAGQRSK